MRTLLIDNYDSYTYNLFQLIAETYAVPPTVVTNDAPEWESLDLAGFDAIVVSPGPGRPQTPRDVGRGLDVLRRADLPVLGVCLGHQALAWLSGADVVPAPVPRHGHLTRIRHDGRGLFAGLPQGFVAVRYHSLCVATPLPAALTATAWAEDGVVMGLAHAERPWWGVQFHPESVATEHGARLLANFRELARARRRPVIVAGRRGLLRDHAAATRVGAVPGAPAAPGTRPSAAPPSGPRPAAPGAAACGPGALRTDALRAYAPAPAVPARRRTAGTDTGGTGSPGEPTGGWSLRYRRLDRAVDAEAAFDALFAAEPYAFWLDSSRVEPGLSRYSFLGAPGGPHGEVLSYRVGTGAVDVLREGRPAGRLAGSIFDVLDARLAERALPAGPELPPDLACGYVGYFGYELKAECGSPNRHVSPVADAVWMAASRFVAVDHAAGWTWVVALCGGDAGSAAEADAWLADACRRLAALDAAGPGAGAWGATGGADEPGGAGDPLADVEPWLVRPRDRYLADVAECLAGLRAGESYEVCLTNLVDLPFPGSPRDLLDLYRRQRRTNPAPYAAYLRLGDTHVLCSSPERFLKVGADRVAESKPIKGTAPRHPDPARDAELRAELAASPKNRAENLMIVDLLRNDLGRVCEVGTVSVPRLMAVESYATVHQLVSTIRGRLRADVSAVRAARACFPGGSMTGAPKLRSIEISDRLETRARGVYSGTIGFFGLTGTADLNIVIRTAVAHGGRLTVGAGGAVVLDSDPAEEYAEMLLKAQAPLRVLAAGGAAGWRP